MCSLKDNLKETACCNSINGRFLSETRTCLKIWKSELLKNILYVKPVSSTHITFIAQHNILYIRFSVYYCNESVLLMAQI